MPHFGVGREAFLDSGDNFRTSVDSSSSYFSVDEDHEFKLRFINPESWIGDLMSVQERRQKFLSTMGFEDFVSSNTKYSLPFKELPTENLPTHIDIRRLTEGKGACLDSFQALDDGKNCINDPDNGKAISFHGHGNNGLHTMLKDVGLDSHLTFQEFEKLVGLPCSVHELMNSDASSSGENQCADRKRHRSWWRRILNKQHIVGMCRHDVSVKNSQLSWTIRTKVLRRRRRQGKLNGLFIEQEIQAHKGSIRIMKFSLSGSYLASGGEDCIVRVWQIEEAETSCKCTTEGGSAYTYDKSKSCSLTRMKSANCASIVFSKKTLKISEKPRHEFCGHTGEILDLSWASSDLLLSSSIDKTVRLWKAGYDKCLQVFLHNDYVTCIQFNPIDERFFISGSIDGKVRIWGISENHVVDWVDIRNIVTAVCYRPDGKAFVVGSINGNCRLYDYTGYHMHLCMQFSTEGRQKFTGRQIAGLQFSPNDTRQIMITSADSTVRVFDEFGGAHKFRGLGKTRCHASASFTTNGRHIISIGAGSSVHIWNYDTSMKPSTRRAKSVRYSEAFFSSGVSVAVPWPEMDDMAADLSTSSLHLQSPMKILGPSTWFPNSDCFFLGSGLFADGASRVGPAEKLPLSGHALPEVERDLIFHLSAMRKMRIVTASYDGFIRSFRNYGSALWL